jgi:MFS family permease
MDESTAITKPQARGLLAAWLGWAFDGLDGYLYNLIAVPFVTLLMIQGTAKAEVVEKASWIQAAFLVGWAIGGAVFGRVGDRIGRTKTLTLTILIYATFTGLSALSETWWQLMILRFIAALGIGGEWAAGSALVSETLHAKHRPWASATLQSGYMVGMILASLTVRTFVGLQQWPARYVFLVGVIPAFVTLWIRKAVPEPEEWQGARSKQSLPKITDLIAPGIRFTTLMVLLLTSLCLTTVWAFLFYNVQVLRALPEVKALSKSAQEDVVFHVTLVFLFWNIAGNFLSNYLAKFLGHRVALAILLAGAFVCYRFGFDAPKSLAETQLWCIGAAITASGVFGIFPLFIPPLFPTLLRTTASGFTYNFGRLAAAVGTLYSGKLVGDHFPGIALTAVAFLYIPAIFVALFVPLKEAKEIPSASAATA